MDAEHGHDHEHGTPTSEADWDARYLEAADGQHHWSGRPNGTLVVEVETMEPGTVLDVGCGEGADAIWLAEHGWQVTAVDVSGVAIERARAAGAAAGVDIAWVHAPLRDVPGGLGTYDLVSAQYPAFTKAAGGGDVDAMLGAVGPSGTLLFVHHDVTAAGDHGFDPSDYFHPADVIPMLGTGWTIEVDEVRDRPGPLPEDARHVRDIVLRARRVAD